METDARELDSRHLRADYRPPIPCLQGVVFLESRASMVLETSIEYLVSFADRIAYRIEAGFEILARMFFANWS